MFGGKAALAGLWVPDEEVAAYTKNHADKTIGFLSVDPTQPGWQDELHHGHQDLKLKGIKLMPMYAGFYPNDRKLDYPLGIRHAAPSSGSAAYGNDLHQPGAARLHVSTPHRRRRNSLSAR